MHALPEQHSCPADAPHAWHTCEVMLQVTPDALQAFPAQQACPVAPHGGKGALQIPDWQVRLVLHVFPGAQHVWFRAPQAGAGTLQTPDWQVRFVLQVFPGEQQVWFNAPHGV